ncbi:type III restriction enzyme [Amanita muscaria]
MNGSSDIESLVPRRYQEEVFRRARRDNIIAALNTGSGKTFISLLLIKWIAAQNVHKGKAIIFLVPRVALVKQQADFISKHTSLHVIKLYGALDLDFSDREAWRKRFNDNDVFVMTAQIFIDILTHSLWSIDKVGLMVFDECHHARKNHPYNGILREYFQIQPSMRPKIFGMTASPIWDPKNPVQSLQVLETNMDAKVVGVVENFSELQEHSPQPVEIIQEYPCPSDDSDYPRPYIHSYVKVFDADLRAIPNFAWSSLEGRYHVTWWSLGPYCASLFLYMELLQVMKRLEQDELKLYKDASIPTNITAISEIVDGFEDFFSKSAQMDMSISIPLSWCTPKVKVLVDILLSHFSPAFQTIIFVEQRQIAACLSRLLPAIPELTGKIYSGHFVGEGVNREGLSSSMGANSGDTLAAFRTGAINTLVATAVAEEGLDFPACDLVIRFDSLQHMVGYVQSRGRARSKTSKFIIMVQKDDSAQLARYQALKAGEPEVARTYLSRMEDDEPEHESDEDVTLADFFERERFVVPETGAVLNYDNAIALLNRLCALIPTDPYTPTHKPKYSGDFVATLRLPTCLPLSEGQLIYHGPRRRTKKEARRAVAFLAVRRLRELDVLDEYLLPGSSSDSDNVEGIDSSAPEITAWPKNIEVMIHDPWVMAPRLWIHDITVHGRRLAGLVTGTRFLSNVMDCRSSRIEIGAGRLVDFSTEGEELEERRDMEEFTRIGINRRLTGSPVRGTLAVFLVPTNEQGQPNFIAIRRLLANPRGCSDWTSVGQHDYNQLLVSINFLSGRTYRLRHIRDDITPLSSPVSGSREDMFPSYRDYFLQRYHPPHVPTDGPMIEVELITRQFSGRYDLNASGQTKITTTVHDGGLFPRNSSRWLDLSPDVFEALELLPAICHRLTDLYRVARLRSFASLPPLNNDLLTEALTLPSAHAGHSNQRLETLGDAVLQLCTTVHIFNQYPNRHEGQLTNLRRNLVCNRFLFSRALCSGLQQFVTNEPFNATRWRFALLESDGWWSCPSRYVKRRIPGRSLQECMEAILGASFLSGGIPVALNTGKSLGLDFSEDPWDTQIVLPNEVDPGLSSSSQYFSKLEASLGYEFHNCQVLLEAVTHPSFSMDSGGRSYQRLEFLGDAVLSLAIMEHLFTRFNEATPHQLSVLRSKVVCNVALAWAAVKRLELQNILLANSVNLNIAISECVPVLEATSAEDIVRNGWRYHPPKALSDVVESVIGAILVDSGYDYDKTATIVLLVMQDLLAVLDLDEVENPVSKLLDWSASQGCRGVKFRVVSRVCGRRTAKGVVVMVHGTAVSEPAMAASARVSRFEAADVALKYLTNEEGEKSLLKLCTCKRNIHVKLGDSGNKTESGVGVMMEDSGNERAEEEMIEMMLLDVDE